MCRKAENMWKCGIIRCCHHPTTLTIPSRKEKEKQTSHYEIRVWGNCWKPTYHMRVAFLKGFASWKWRCLAPAVPLHSTLQLEEGRQLGSSLTAWLFLGNDFQPDFFFHFAKDASQSFFREWEKEKTPEDWLQHIFLASLLFEYG